MEIAVYCLGCLCLGGIAALAVCLCKWSDDAMAAEERLKHCQSELAESKQLADRYYFEFANSSVNMEWAHQQIEKLKEDAEKYRELYAESSREAQAAHKLADSLQRKLDEVRDTLKHETIAVIGNQKAAVAYKAICRRLIKDRRRLKASVATLTKDLAEYVRSATLNAEDINLAYAKLKETKWLLQNVRQGVAKAIERIDAQ